MNSLSRITMLSKWLSACMLMLVSFSSFQLANAVDNQSAVSQVSANQTRIKDLARLEGVRSNQLLGYGLVIGLPGSGDSKASLATNKAISNLLSRLGSVVGPGQVTTKNVASVVVTADLPAFAKSGDKLDVRISSVGDAKSLAGGTLILTPLQGADGQTYAVAQGHLSMGTSLTGGSGGSSQADSPIKTIGLSNSGTVEREFPSTFMQNGQIKLSLIHSDFTTASRVARAINSFYGEFMAKAVNAGYVTVNIPSETYTNPSFQVVDFVASVEQIKVASDTKARIVINERTGTVISGRHVQIDPVAISHGYLEIEVKNSIQRIENIKKTTTLGELVQSLNALGAGPKDLVAIVQALERAGALNAEIVFM